MQLRPKNPTAKTRQHRKESATVIRLEGPPVRDFPCNISDFFRINPSNTRDSFACFAVDLHHSGSLYVQIAGEGRSYREAADLLGVSVATVQRDDAEAVV